MQLILDTSCTFQGTKELGDVLKTPGVVGELCQVMGTSTAPQVRQYAAVILRKRLGKSRHWVKLEADVKNGYVSYHCPSQEVFYKKLIKLYIHVSN